MMHSKYIDKQIDYDGSQLKALYSYVNHRIHGDSIVSFSGACDVTLEHMVDAEDFVESAKIKSDKMLHFIIEIFNHNLTTAVSLQRLLVSQAQHLLHESGQNLRRDGDDLFLADKKLSVSIASRSAVSAMIHLGINIGNEGTPVPTCSLSDLGIEPKSFSLELMKRFSSEYDSIIAATQKVRPLDY